MADLALDVDRRRVEARLEALVADNRLTIAVVFPLVGMVLLVASEASLLPPALSFNPYLILLGTAVMRLPLLVGIAPLVDRRGALGLVALTLFTYGVEFLGVLTGVPYGEFAYGIELGPMLFGLVPAGLPLFFFPLVLNSYLLVLCLSPALVERRWARLGAAVGTLVVVDLVLDPAAVVLGFWSYPGGGVYYGVPVSNYLGWVLSGAVALVLVELSFDASAVARRLQRCPFALDDLVSFVVLWGTVNAVYGNWVPVALAAGLAGALVATDRFDFRVWR